MYVLSVGHRRAGDGPTRRLNCGDNMFEIRSFQGDFVAFPKHSLRHSFEVRERRCKRRRSREIIPSAKGIQPAKSRNTLMDSWTLMAS